MITLTLEREPRAIDVAITNEKLIVTLNDGRVLAIPLAWYPRLNYGSPAERQNWQLLGEGYAIEWPELDEHIGVEGLLAGRRSTESQRSLTRWLNARNILPTGSGTTEVNATTDNTTEAMGHFS